MQEKKIDALYLARLNYSNYGGAEKYLTRILRYFRDTGTPHKVLSAKSGYENAIKIALPRFAPSFLKPLFFSNAVCKLKQKERFFLFSLERVVCADIYRAGDGVHASWIQKKRSKLPFWRRILSYLTLKDYVYLYLEKRLFRNAKKIIANSESIKREIIHYYGIAPETIAVVHNGIEIHEGIKTESLKQELGISDQTVILYVGNGFFRKGVKEALELLAPHKEENFIFLIVGGDKKSAMYKRYAKQLGLESKVRFMGEQKEVERFYVLSDIFLFPTLYDPFSNATLEAMGYQNAILTTRENGVSELLDATQILDTPQRLGAFLHDKTLVESAKKRNLEIAKTLTVEKNVQETLDVIRSVYENRY